ncbi:hypothetical protein TRIUR3_10859 [Triticum urartu]|uniref:Uncharacterized protein n=1 Tax=Triticum urartu TaxID=4572 RepID=M8ANT2_TRIUA|nr:hypothetical protein TRIUR3_10859 [Triticum urartu]
MVGEINVERLNVNSVKVQVSVILFGWIGAWNKMDEFELEDNLEFILQSIQELIEDQGDNNPFGEVNQNELLANLVNYDQDNLMPDVSAEDVVNGKDVQGIPWEKMLFPRDQYREMKMKGYKNYQNLSYAREDALQCSEFQLLGYPIHIHLLAHSPMDGMEGCIRMHMNYEITRQWHKDRLFY